MVPPDFKGNHFSLPNQWMTSISTKYMPGPKSSPESSFGQRNGIKYLSLAGVGQARGRHEKGPEPLKSAYPKELKAES